MCGFLNNGVKHLLHIYSFRFQNFYSTSTATSRTNFLVETLVNSLGFSPQEALSTSAKTLVVGMSAFLNNGVKQLLHVYRFRFHVFYSKAAVAATSDTNFLVETLVNSLGFSPQEALSTSAKIVMTWVSQNEVLGPRSVWDPD
ncbi:uncharacterized protein [Nicotiana sylvestris]|uniref:Uncharacterized protein LOC104215074 isoform X3 n=1 Tax=Nicotiana sylvestris TaxID=4096 RepID=A0A1U7VMM6_NICSY|nr:PREDICTED: uncharacterized protein LOC104215074 isoform X3 [Nicotiana sylvestris]